MKHLIFFFCATFILNSGIAQSKILGESTYYKNVEVYVSQAADYIAQRRYSDAKKKLKYANQFAEKLIKQGHEKEIQSLLQRVKILQKQLPENDELTSKNEIDKPMSGEALSRTEFRDAIKSLSDKQSQLQRLFTFFPHFSEIKDYHRKYVADFQSTEILARIEQLRKEPQAAQSYHIPHLRQLDKVEALAKDLENAMHNSPIAQNLESTYAYLKAGTRTPEEQQFVFQQVEAYLDLLDQLQANSLFVQSQVLKANTFKNTLLNNQKASRQAAAAEQAQENTVAANAAKQIPTAQTRDPAMEKEFSGLAKPYLEPNNQLVKMIITSSRWGIQKDALGRPLERSRIAIALYKDRQGQCFQRSFIFAQKTANSGVSWTQTKLDLDWSEKKGRPSNCQ